MHRIHSLISPLGIVAGLLLMVMAPSLASVAHGDRRRRQPQAAVSTAADTARPALSYNDRRRYDYFFLEAVRQQNAGHYDAAFDLLSHCVEIDPHAAEAYYLLAMYHTELGNDSTALAYLGRAAELRGLRRAVRARRPRHDALFRLHLPAAARLDADAGRHHRRRVFLH